MNFKGETILVVVAHPDDEVLGMGATIHKLSKNNDIHVMFLNGASNIRKENNLKIEEVYQQIVQASETLGVKSTVASHFNACRFDSYDQVEINNEVSHVVNYIKPTIVFTHDVNDLNQDHRIVLEAVLVSCRTRKKSTVKSIYSFPVLSSSNWNLKTIDINVYSQVSKANLSAKIKAMKCYSYEYSYDPLRQDYAIMNTARFYGLDVEARYCEVFKLIRQIWQG